MTAARTTATPAPAGPHRPPAATAVLRRKCACGGTPGPTGECEACRKKRLALQRKRSAPGGGARTPAHQAAGPAIAPPVVHRALAAPGRSLERAVRAPFEARFGHDLSRVRVHDDRLAAASARAVAAEAYTVGPHVVFAAGRYAPASAAGRRLLAHELAHVVQQGPAARVPSGPLPVGRPADPAEREADAAERTGGRPRPLRRRLAALRRKATVNASPVLEPVRKDAKACLVHLHADEKNALTVAKEEYKNRCANLVWVDNRRTGRLRNLEVSDGTDTCGDVDPNRIFSTTTVKEAATKCSKKSTADFQSAIGGFRDGVGKKISACRGGGGTADMAGPLPVVAIHNNTPGDEAPAKGRPHGGTSISKYERQIKAKKFAGRTKPAAASAPKELQGADEFVYTTDVDPGGGAAKDFDALAGKVNLVEQARGSKGRTKDDPATGTPKDDGSLSVFLEDQRYLNVESGGRSGKAALDVNRSIVKVVLDHLGVGKCPESPGSGETKNPAKEPAKDPAKGPEGPSPQPPGSGGEPKLLRRREPKAPSPGDREPVPPRTEEPGARDGLSALAEEMARGLSQIYGALSRIVEEILRLLRDLIASLPPAKAPVPKGCEKQTFADQAALDAARDGWRKRIDAMKEADVVAWIVGSGLPAGAVGTDVDKEVKEHKDCLEQSFQAAAAAKGSGLALPKGRTGLTISPHLRTYADQQNIWSQKFDFTRAGTWGRITAAARKKCGALIKSTEVEWDNASARKTDHEACWKKLSDDEKQLEILQTSSAPGVSRHHLGTDFDFSNLSPDDWTKTGTKRTELAEEYDWLVLNASTYGFIQPFTPAAVAGGKLGYVEERWHWSYYPIAQALVPWGAAHKKAIAAELPKTKDWAANPSRYTFILAHWQDYFFNVSSKATF